MFKGAILGLVAAVAARADVASAQPPAPDPVFESAPFDAAHWTFEGKDIQPAEPLGVSALRLQDGVATLKIADFASGIIAYDVLLASDAPIYTGIRFHGLNENQYEYFYLRAERSGFVDSNQYTPVFNGDQGWQIYAGPEFSSEEGYKRVGWNHVEVRLYPDAADIYINGRRSLRIPDLKTGHAGGYVALASSYGPRFPFNQAYYANVRYSLTPLARPADMPAPARYHPEGLVAHWQVSPAMPVSAALAWANGNPAHSNIAWTALPTETNGIANLSRIDARSPEKNAAIARFEVSADRKGSRLMRFGYSDAVDIFVNGQPVFRGDAEFRSRDVQFLGTVGFKDTVAVPLRAGANDVVFVVRESFGGWAAAAAFVESKGLSGPALAIEPR